MNAINKYVIVEKETEENISTNGIIQSSNEQKTIYTVIATTEETKELQGRQIFAKEYFPLEEDKYGVNIDDIVSWK